MTDTVDEPGVRDLHDHDLHDHDLHDHDLHGDDLESARARTRAVRSRFPDECWRETDLNRRYLQEFVDI